MKIIGYRRVSFKANDGNQVNGYTLFVTEPFSTDEKDCGGVKSDKIFVKVELFENLMKDYSKRNLSPINQEIQVFYNKYGKAEQIIPR